jgi:neural Wiskott-Aldrich syndrome protein
MATTDNSWMPAGGRHPVGVGSSLGRALKARKGAPPTKKANLPDRDFYSFRCSSHFILTRMGIINIELYRQF